MAFARTSRATSYWTRAERGETWISNFLRFDIIYVRLKKWKIVEIVNRNIDKKKNPAASV